MELCHLGGYQLLGFLLVGAQSKSFIDIYLSYEEFFVIDEELSDKFIFFGVPYDGFGTLLIVNMTLFSLLFLILGILSEYLALMYEELKARPNFIVSRKHGL